MATSRDSSVFDPEVTSLPSGYTGLPRQLVEASQRQRLVHGLAIAVARKGFAATTITDIVEHARVSRKTFYEHFADKHQCLLMAYDLGSSAMLAAARGAMRAAVAEGDSPVDQLRHGVEAYVRFLAAEPAYSRMFLMEMLAAGDEAVARQRACRRDVTHGLREWHARARVEYPEWPEVSVLKYEAATGAVHELTLERIVSDRAETLPDLVDDLVDIQLAIIGVPR